MPFLADEHDGFQAALTFVDEYVSSSSEFDEEPETRHQSAASESAVWRHHRKQPVIEELLLEQDDDDDDDELFPLVELISEDMDGVPSSSQRAVREAAMAAAGQPIAHPPASPQKQRLQQQQQPPHQAVVPSVNKSKKKSGPKKPITWNPNKARDERKQELLYLRKQVVELETQLQVVQKKKPRTAASPYQIVPAPMAPHQRQQQNVYAYPRMLPQNNPAVACVWKEVASRQSEERIKSERENIRLKIVLENQIKIAKSLESILTKRASTTEIEKCLDAKRLSHIFPTSIDRTDIGTFEDLLAGVEQSYAEVDAVLEANGLAQIEKTHSNAQLHTNTGNGMFLEIFASKVLPFGIHSTASAVWHHFVFAKERQPQRHYYNKAPKVSVPEICSYVKTTDSTEDTLVENFNLVLQANRTSANFQVKQILRRYDEEDRVVIVWRAFIDPIEFSDAPLSGLRFLEKGYIVIKKPTTIAGDYSLLQTVYITKPTSTGDLDAGEHPQVGAISDFVVSATEANIRASHQMIENVLLEQAMKNIGRV